MASTTGRFDDDADAEDVMLFYTPIRVNLQSQCAGVTCLGVGVYGLAYLWPLGMMIGVAC